MKNWGRQRQRKPSLDKWLRECKKINEKLFGKKGYNQPPKEKIDPIITPAPPSKI